MGMLDEYIAGMPGYFRDNAEENFPWQESGRIVWYAIFLIEDSKIVHYGFTSSKSNKQGLLQALIKIRDVDSAKLIGVWTGQYRTDLFDLNIEKAISKLKSVLAGE
jgi:hypothetical protein